MVVDNVDDKLVDFMPNRVESGDKRFKIGSKTPQWRIIGSIILLISSIMRYLVIPSSEMMEI